MELKKNSAFTMIEIMVVVAIIAGLLAILGPRVAKYMGQSDIKMTKLKIAKVKDALTSYRLDMGHFPRSAAPENGLESLLRRPSTKLAEEKWGGDEKEAYLDDEDDIRDKWNDDLEYNCPPVKYKNKYRSFEIISMGGDSGNEITDGK